mmetsp:Transcript_27518/g.60552  ORF Transcript_27518/g.60552 Transcript_27518/m.60552 type:complete len:331 (-) Transcript_27518:43-1035(-)
MVAMAKMKGNKWLSLIEANRWYRYIILFGFSVTIISRAWNFPMNENDTDTVGSMSSFSSLRPPNESLSSATAATTKNVALYPPELRPDPTMWSIMTREDMDKYLECDYEIERAIHTPETWIGMREAYISVVGSEKATVELVPNTEKTFETAFRLQFEVRQSPGKGRGIFARTNVPRGEILYDFSQSAQFKKGSEFAEFLRILRPELACDVLMWSYVQYFGEGVLGSRSNPKDYESQLSDLRIVVDLDPGSFCNDGGRKKGNMAWLNSKGQISRQSNVNDPPSARIRRRNGSIREDAVKSAPLVAIRDIAAGEELMCIYNQFSEGLGLMIK